MGKKLPEILTEEEQEQLLKQPNPRYFTGERNYIMLKLMLDNGLRLSEATNLKWRDIDLMTGKLMIRNGKGSKDRTLWTNEENLELLRNWKERQVKEIGFKSTYVFTTLKGSKVQSRYVQAMVKRLAGKAKIEKNISPHTLRHTFATDLYRKTKNIRMVQKALGHADLSSTMIYTHIVDDELEGALKTFRSS